MRDVGREWRGEWSGGELEGGEEISEKGGRVPATREGGRKKVFVIFLVHVQYVSKPSAVKGCIKPTRIDTCVLYKVSDSCCPILLKVPTSWGSFEIKNVRLAKIMLRQLSG